MKSKTKFAVLLLLPLSLASCGQKIGYADNLGDYVFTMRYHDDFNILQLSDIHWNFNTPTAASKRYLDKVIAEADKHIKAAQGPGAKIDLVELTGDQFMLANTYHVGTFVDYFEAQAAKYGFLYAITWGNHDNHGLYNPNWLSKTFASATHSLYLDLDDDLYGRSNFIIDLTSDGTKAGQVKWQIANLDSGASFSETAISPFRDYDYIRPDQTDWWVKQHARVGEEVPGIAYYHIPQQDNGIAYKQVQDGAKLKNKFFKLENFGDNGTGNYISNFIDEASKHNLKAAFQGHAHNVDWTVLYKGVTLGLGVKTGPELYYAHVNAKDTDPAVKAGLASTGITENFDLIGASLVTLTKEDGSFGLEHLYLNERASGDFVEWVAW